MQIQANPVSRVYAEALFRVARSRNIVPDIEESLRGVAFVLGAQPALRQFLAAPMIDTARKKAVVEKALQGRVEPLVVDFLCLLIDRKRESVIEGAVQQFRVLADEAAGRVRVSARTPQPLTEAQSSALQNVLQQALQRQCTLEASVEPELIGGLVLRIGDKLYDGSVRRQLQRVGDQLMRSSGYEN